MNIILMKFSSAIVVLLFAFQTPTFAEGNLPQTETDASGLSACNKIRFDLGITQDSLNDEIKLKKRANRKSAALKTDTRKKNTQEAKLRNQLKKETDTSKQKALKKEIRKVSNALKKNEREAKELIKGLNYLDREMVKTKKKIKGLKAALRKQKCK